MNAGAGLVPYDGRTYNYAPVNYLQTPFERFNLFADGKFEVTDNIEFFASVRANFRDSAQELAPLPYDSATDPAYDGSFGATAYHGMSENNFYLAAAQAAAGLASQPLTDVRRRVTETTRRFTQDITQWQGVFGFEGTLGDVGAFSDLDWNVTYNKGYRARTDQDFGQFYGPNLANAMGPSADLDGDGTPECYGDIADPTTLITGCVPINLVGGFNNGVGTVTQDMLDYVSVDLIDQFTWEQDIASAVISGSAFELPAGQVHWAFGGGWWLQSFEYNPDSAKQLDQVTGNTGAGTDGELESYNLFFETSIPVYDNGQQQFNLQGGVRYDDYDQFSAETTWQVGGHFQVVSAVKLRGTVGTVFRAPAIDDLFGGIVDSFPTYSDPCIPAAGQPLPPGCAQVGVQLDQQLLARVGGNPDLTPETGDTYTVGAVFTPTVPMGDFSATVDWWKTKIDDGISSLGVQFILDDCYIRQNAASCALITRTANYDIDNVRDTQLNVAQQEASGIDVELNYALSTDVGDWDASIMWTHLLDRSKVPFEGAATLHLDGRYTDPTAEDGGAYAEDKLNYTLRWSRDVGPGNLTLSYLGQFISGLDADTFCNCGPIGVAEGAYIQDIDSVLYHDIVGSYQFPTQTRVTFGITNLTDEKPPYIEIGFNATTDPSTYRMFGIGYWFRLEQSF
jgi:outer membrane receptor protein involved in Fe transport